MNPKTFSSRFYRLLEAIPGLIAWNIILFPIWGSFLFPRGVAYFVIGFLIFWLYQSLETAILGVIGYLKIKKSQSINWHQKYQSDKKNNWKEWKDIKHIIIIPNANESVEKISTNLDCLLKQENVLKEQINIVLAMEERVKNSHLKAEELLKKYKSKFSKIITTFHPANISGEIIGKASNEAWAAKRAKEVFIDNLGWNIDNLVITSCDADACFHPKYFSALTYHFAKNRKRHFRFWQSPILWHNNLNRVPAPIRIVGIIGDITHIAHLQEPEKLIFNYSAYSLSFKLLHKVGYWDPDIIPEDWHIFLQSFFATKGQANVIPIFVPTSIDAPEGKSYFEALKSRYLQCQRHAWGATDIPYAIIQAKKHPEIPLLLKLLRIYKLLETHLIWSTNWFIITLGATLPPLLNRKFFQTSFGYNLPKFSQIILTICLVFLLVVIILDWRLQPKPTKKLSFLKKVGYVLQWITMPISTLFMAVLPGLDAQTKLLFGKRIEYKVTKKY